FNGGTDSFESSPYVTLSRGAFSAPSLVTHLGDSVPRARGSRLQPCSSPCRLPRTLPRGTPADPFTSPLLRSSPMATPTTRDPPDASSPHTGQRAPARAQRQAYRRRKARARARSEARRQEEAGRAEALPLQHPHAAGIAIGSRS